MRGDRRSKKGSDKGAGESDKGAGGPDKGAGWRSAPSDGNNLRGNDGDDNDVVNARDRKGDNSVFDWKAGIYQENGIGFDLMDTRAKKLDDGVSKQTVFLGFMFFIN